jgi:CheY-like chemotaxis protein
MISAPRIGRTDVAVADPLTPVRPTATRGRVLVVEDDAAIRVMLSDLLNDAGYAVLEASTGKEALRRLREQAPDVIVLDLMLPELSGWEFLNRARQQPGGLQAPVVVLSAIAGKSDYPSALGVAGWFTKPLNVDAFLSTLGRLGSSLSY